MTHLNKMKKEVRDLAKACMPERRPHRVEITACHFSLDFKPKSTMQLPKEKKSKLNKENRKPILELARRIPWRQKIWSRRRKRRRKRWFRMSKSTNRLQRFGIRARIGLKLIPLRFTSPATGISHSKSLPAILKS